MTLQELLKAQNLTDEQVKGILDAMKQNKIYTASEENLDVRYGKLKTDHDAMVAKDAESQKLIAELQKATKGQEDVQTKITEYEATIQKQQEELAEAKTESALKIGLLSAGAKATDIDYLIYKMNHDSDPFIRMGDTIQISESEVNDGLYVVTEVGKNFIRLSECHDSLIDNNVLHLSSDNIDSLEHHVGLLSLPC